MFVIVFVYDRACVCDRVYGCARVSVSVCIAYVCWCLRIWLCLFVCVCVSL